MHVKFMSHVHSQRPFILLKLGLVRTDLVGRNADALGVKGGKMISAGNPSAHARVLMGFFVDTFNRDFQS